MPPKYALSESESEPDAPETTVPSDDALEKALRDTVAGIYKSGKMEELTVKRVRLAAEKALSLEQGFYKGHSTWKAKSDEVIKNEVEVQDKKEEASGPDDDGEDEPIAPAPKKATLPKRTKQDTSSASRKRQKTSSPESAEKIPLSEESEEEVKKPAKKQAKATKKSPKETSEEEPADSDAAKSEEPKAEPDAGSESEMSVVLDEEPQPSKKAKKTETAPKGKKKAPPKGKDSEVDPNQEEIKRLQGWLVKCGIRKMWWRELAPYDTPKAKIQHLKDMLKEAGMTGRYSLDKARQIREERELKADLEMVQEGAKLWGKESGGEEDDTSRPRRRLNRGRQALAFLESDREESD